MYVKTVQKTMYTVKNVIYYGIQITLHTQAVYAAVTDVQSKSKHIPDWEIPSGNKKIKKRRMYYGTQRNSAETWLR